MTIDVSPCPQGNGVRFVTRGLVHRGLHELEMIAVPEGHEEDARAVLESVAFHQYLEHSNSRIVDGERVVVMGIDGVLCARLVAAEQGEPTGLREKLLGKQVVFRIVEPNDAPEYPKGLLSTAAVWRARALINRDEVGAAQVVLLKSIACFPGDPAKRSDAPPGLHPYNWENCLAYEALADVGDGDRAAWLNAAFARSVEFEIGRVGDTSEDLKALNRVTLTAIAQRIDTANDSAKSYDIVTDDTVMIRSPLRTRLDGLGQPLADTRLTVVPMLIADYGLDRLAEPREVHELVADIVLKHAHDPAFLLGQTEETQVLYESDDGEPQGLDDLPEYECGERIVSIVLADVTRRMYAGLSMHELRVFFELTHDEEALLSGYSKMDVLLAREDEVLFSDSE